MTGARVTRRRAHRGLGRPAPRLAALVLVLGLLAVAAWLDRDTRAARSEIAASGVTGPRLPRPDAVSTAWYCAEGTAVPQGRADERIVIANLGDRTARAGITVMPGGDAAAATRTIDVAARRVARVRVADLAAVPDPGVIVEVEGGRAVVAHELAGSDDVAVGPCAREPAADWTFASGTTSRNAQLWLALFNPFDDDAIVDVTFLTKEGVREPGVLSGLVVPRRSRVAVPVHDRVPREDVVATMVRTRRGRVVAEQSQVLEGSDGRRGLALSLGATRAATTWRFANGYTTDGRAQSLVIANPAQRATTVRIDTRLDGAATLEPLTLPVPPTAVIVVDITQRVPANTGFWYSVRATGPAPVVAETSVATTAPTSSTRRGYATTVGSTVLSRRWVLVPARASATSGDYLSVVNPGPRSVRFRVTLVGGGEAQTPASVREVRIAPGRRALVELGSLGATVDSAAVIDANRPVLVEREGQGGPGETLAPAIPDLG